MLAIERTVNDPSRLLNDFGVPSLNRVPFGANPNLSIDPGMFMTKNDQVLITRALSNEISI